MRFFEVLHCAAIDPALAALRGKVIEVLHCAAVDPALASLRGRVIEECSNTCPSAAYYSEEKSACHLL